MGLLYLAITLGILIGIHEWGHYAVARLCRVAVSDFAIGFGPELFGWTNKNGTRFSLRLIPLGGYVKMKGEQQTDDATDEEKATGFAYKSPWQRMAIAVAGPAVNIAFALVVFTFMAMAGKPVVQAEIGQVEQGMPAAAAGIVAGDVITAINGTAVANANEASEAIVAGNTAPMTITVDRNGTPVTITLTPDAETKRIGIRYSGEYTLEDGEGPLGAVAYAVDTTWKTSGAIFSFLGDLVTGERGINDMGGLVSIGKAADQSASVGWYVFFGFLAMISINLAIMNLLPIPGLDGSHIVLTFLEGIGLKLPAKAVNMLFVAGFLFLISFMVLVNINDILRLESVQDILAKIFGGNR